MWLGFLEGVPQDRMRALGAGCLGAAGGHGAGSACRGVVPGEALCLGRHNCSTGHTNGCMPACMHALTAISCFSCTRIAVLRNIPLALQVQDESAGLVVALLDPQPGELVLDACAAPGGKSLYAAARMRGQVRASVTAASP